MVKIKSKKLGKFLKAHRKSVGVSLNHFAHYCEESYSSMRNIEEGIGLITPKVFKEYAGSMSKEKKIEFMDILIKELESWVKKFKS